MNFVSLKFKYIFVNFIEDPLNYNFAIKKQVFCLENQQSKRNKLRGFPSSGIN